VSFNTRYAVGTFYDRYRRNLNFGPAVRLNENFNASVNLQFNDIEPSTGAFVSKLLTTRARCHREDDLHGGTLGCRRCTSP
jgi:hypothetical protein